MKSYIKILFSTLFGILLFSCNSNREEEYQPISEVMPLNNFKLSIVDIKGNDLLTDKNFVNTISVIGNLSKKTQTFSTIKWDKDGGFNFVEVYTDLPDKKSIPDMSKITYTSTDLFLKIADISTKLQCDFRYVPSSVPGMFVNNSIRLIKIKIGTEEIDVDPFGENSISIKNLILVYDNGTISVKK